jgi:hypothetical protein
VPRDEKAKRRAASAATFTLATLAGERERLVKYARRHLWGAQTRFPGGSAGSDP